MTDDAGTRHWQLALKAMEVLAVAPAELGGIVLRAAPGPIRDIWLEMARDLTPERSHRRIPHHVPESRLVGGLDLALTLKTGSLVHEQGLLADCHEGVGILPMAERTPARTAAQLCAALDTGEVITARDGITKTSSAAFALVALDEGLVDEAIDPALADRLAFWVDLHPVSIRDVASPEVSSATIERASATWRDVDLSEAQLEMIATATFLLGVASPRSWIHCANTARILATLEGNEAVSDSALTQAIELVLGHRATRLPMENTEPAPGEEPSEPQDAPQNDPPEPPQPPEPPPPNQSDSPEQEDDTVNQIEQEVDAGDAVVEAISAAIPAALLQHLQAGLAKQRSTSGGGKSGSLQKHRSRGRPVGTQPGDPRAGQRLSLLATLRAAIPQQKLRTANQPRDLQSRAPLDIRKEDFRVVRFKHRTESTTIFVVDASGSAAIHRLAEAKGAVELLLADCYVRRDQVALIAFRGEEAELLLPPTRSLVRAKRCLSALPGGGGTPLASAVDMTAALIPQIERRGSTAGVVFLTDGLANIARDGRRGREAASEDALNAARQLRSLGSRCLVIDSAPRPQPRAKSFAEALDATYVAMPSVSADNLRGVVKAAGLQN